MNRYINLNFVDYCVAFFVKNNEDKKACLKYAKRGEGNGIYGMSKKLFKIAHEQMMLDRTPSSSESILIAAQLIKYYSEAVGAIADRRISTSAKPNDSGKRHEL